MWISLISCGSPRSATVACRLSSVVRKQHTTQANVHRLGAALVRRDYQTSPQLKTANAADVMAFCGCMKDTIKEKERKERGAKKKERPPEAAAQSPQEWSCLTKVKKTVVEVSDSSHA